LQLSPGQPKKERDNGHSALAGLLREAEEHHGGYEPAAPKHNWWDWYAAYIDARHNGHTPDESAASAGTYIAGLFAKG
jgi:hypothetical protein